MEELISGQLLECCVKKPSEAESSFLGKALYLLGYRFKCYIIKDRIAVT